ncbi:MAG: PspC domain-containing protein [Pseudomonadales bacterium]
MINSNREQLRRSPHRALLGGVCSGFADYLGTDPTIVRIALLTFGLFFSQIAVLGYAIAWGLMRP